ncbi:MAG TPA: glycosyltransferase family 1 protein [Chitinophagaceae bacterium]|nr:glycosyltransferase family 1 protein [Chitinophagaceae bacterium]
MKTQTTLQAASAIDAKFDLICFSHLRWDFVYQRPQHLFSRFASHLRTFFIEEPLFGEGNPSLNVKFAPEGIYIITPQLPHGLNEEQVNSSLRTLLDNLLLEKEVDDYVLWYYTPMALQFSDHLTPTMTVYDCMDELSAFKFAPAALKELEKDLLNRADLVFTGGVSLYEFKKQQHHNIYPFPSSIDYNHFHQARNAGSEEPEDQRSIPHPRIGFYGVVDERFDIELLDKVSEQRPDWQFVILGPVVKIDPAVLPRRSNVHYLGGKSYKELPAYLSGWDIAMIPFARNESTRFISPTKTPEYLAAGKPVISTSIKDVVDPYGKNKLVSIADTADEFIAAAERILQDRDNQTWLQEVDAFLANNSWDNTWAAMMQLMNMTIKDKSTNTKKTKEAYV